MKCDKHPRYQLKRKPTSDCYYCNRMWEEKNRIDVPTTGCRFCSELMKTVREFLDEISAVPFRAVDCDQDKVDYLMDKLDEMTGREDVK